MRTIIEKMTLKEKASLLSQIVWETTILPDSTLENFLLADGPSGIRRLKEYFDTDICNTLPAICYPSPSTYASSWNRELIFELGINLGIEAKSVGVDVLLGPGVNLKRSPLGGRNFEYYSEDPYVTSELATEYIRGLQNVGTGACIKHFALNNQETRRMTINVQIEDEPLQELYLSAFKKPIIEGKPWMVMSAYNQVNGEYCADSSYLIRNILREEWRYNGVVVTDCFAAHELDKGIKNGLNLQMPGETAERLEQRIESAIAKGDITEKELEMAIEKVIDLERKISAERKKVECDYEEQHQFAKKVALESMVLLKNENNILPLKREDKVGVIGEMAIKPRFQGGGSSHVNPWKLENCLEELLKVNSEISFARGYQDDVTTEKLISEAEKIAKKVEKVIVFIGLPEIYESEGYDRKNLCLPQAHIELLERIYRVNTNIIVVLFNGAPVEMPWLHKTQAVLEAYLPGEAGGSAITDILYGNEVPCGHLAETFPICLSDTPCYLNFPGDMNRVSYREGFLIGYRYYNTSGTKVLFPFGYGLSYTEFEYENLEAVWNEQDKVIDISVKVKNVGDMTGKTLLQIYVEGPDQRNGRPKRELKQFSKVELQPKETEIVKLKIHEDELKILQYSDESKWILRNGRYKILAGKSVEDICLSAEIDIISGVWPEIVEDTCLGDIIQMSGKLEILKKELEKHPRSMEFVDFCACENPLDISMGALMSVRNLKRTDPTLTEEDIEKILNKLNQ